MDGQKDVEVEGGAWSLTPGLGSNGSEWGRLEDGRGEGKYCLRFWVDVKNTAKKGDVTLGAGMRLFFAINVIDKKELPTLQAQIVDLGEKVMKYEETGADKKGTRFEKLRNFTKGVKGYDEHKMNVAQW